jgi:hypothetical protein
VADQFETGVAEQMLDIGLGPSEEIVGADNVVPIRQ